MMTVLSDWCGLSYTKDIVLGEEEAEFHVEQAVGGEQSNFFFSLTTGDLKLTQL